MKNRLKIATRNLFDLLSIFFVFLPFPVDFGLQNGGPNFVYKIDFFRKAYLGAPGGPQELPRSSPGANLRDIWVVSGEFGMSFSDVFVTCVRACVVKLPR